MNSLLDSFDKGFKAYRAMIQTYALLVNMKSMNSHDMIGSIEQLYETNKAAYEPHKKFHGNQEHAAKLVLENFNKDNRYVMLSAQMQSGKTGCAFYVAFKMLLDDEIDKLFIMSGSSETELREQWRKEYPEYLTCFCIENDLNPTDHKEMVQKLAEKVEKSIIWRQDLLKKSDMFTERFLIIWDESHYATTEKQTLHRFFEEIGLLKCLQGDTSYLRSKNAYILSVTATRCAEQSRYVGANDGKEVHDWSMVVMEPGEEYRGVQHMMKYGLIKEAKTINEDNMSYLARIFEKYQSQRKYMVIRCNEKKDTLITQLAAQMEIPVIRYNMNEKQTLGNLKIAPPKFSLFLIRGMLRMGKEMPKEHIAAVYEGASCSKTNTTLQGLLGRSCGYYNKPELRDVVIDVYIPKGDQNDAVNQYITSIESGFKIGISGTLLVPKQHKQRTRRTHIPLHIKKDLLKDLYTSQSASLAEMKQDPSIVCRDLEQLVNLPGMYDFSKMSVDDQKQIRDNLKKAANGDQAVLDNIKVENTHTSKGIKVTSKKHVVWMHQAIKNNQPVSHWKAGKELKSCIRIVQITKRIGLEETDFHPGDLVVIFNTLITDAEQNKNPTNETDIFHTHADTAKNVKVVDDDGIAKSRLPSEVKDDKNVLKRGLTELITHYLDPKSVVISATGCKTGDIPFSKKVYKNEKYFKAILKSIEDSFKGKISIRYELGGKGRSTLCEEGCIRLKKIW